MINMNTLIKRFWVWEGEVGSELSELNSEDGDSQPGRESQDEVADSRAIFRERERENATEHNFIELAEAAKCPVAQI